MMTKIKESFFDIAILFKMFQNVSVMIFKNKLINYVRDAINYSY